MNQNLKMGLIVGGAYLAGGIGTLIFCVAKGASTGKSFDGITGNESPAIKALECVVAWPFALVKAMTA